MLISDMTFSSNPIDGGYLLKFSLIGLPLLQSNLWFTLEFVGGKIVHDADKWKTLGIY